MMVSDSKKLKAVKKLCNFCDKSFVEKKLIPIPFKASVDSPEMTLLSCSKCLISEVPKLNKVPIGEEQEKKEIYKWTKEELEEYEAEKEINRKKNWKKIQKMKGKLVYDGPCRHYAKSYRENGVFCKDCDEKISSFIK